MIGSLIGMAGNIAMSVAQANENNRAYRREVDDLNRYRNEERNVYDRLRNADATQLADNSAALTRGLETLRKSNRAAQGRQAVVGGTNASVAAEKEASNRAYADMIRNVAANGQRYKQDLDNQYKGTRNYVYNRNNQIEAGRHAGRLAALDVANKAFGMAGQAMEGAESAYVARNTEPKVGPIGQHQATTNTVNALNAAAASQFKQAPTRTQAVMDLEQQSKARLSKL